MEGACDPKFLGGQVRADTGGVDGMRNALRACGGNLAVWGEVDSGTEVELTIQPPRLRENPMLAADPGGSGRRLGIGRRSHEPAT